MSDAIGLANKVTFIPKAYTSQSLRVEALTEVTVAVKRLSARIHGRVQGVGFRYFTREVALELGVSGWVRNTWDGDVEVMAEGEEGRLARFVGMLRDGPPRAEVEGIDVTWSEPENISGRFYVR